MVKLGLGTVQFGQAYGVSNMRGQVNREEASVILKRAHAGGVRVLDTAANYGEAENVLAALDTSGFRIVTKTIGTRNGADQVVARARQSAKCLQADTLLVHSAADLADASLWPALQSLKDQGVFRRIGISAYVADDPLALARHFKPDVMQIPFSLLDQRLLKSGALEALKRMGVEIHARSIFLQGLLFLETLPEKLRHAALELSVIKATIASAGITPLAAALAFVLARPEIDVALVGVTSVGELEDILAAAESPLPSLDWSTLALSDEKVLTPSLW